MKALSLRPDYAYEVASGEKKHEYRSWNTNHRGDLLICSNSRKLKDYISGHALCVVNLKDVKKLSDGTYDWILDNVRVIKPFEVKGKQKPFHVDDDLIKYPEKHYIIYEDDEEMVSEEFFIKYHKPLIY